MDIRELMNTVFNYKARISVLERLDGVLPQTTQQLCNDLAAYEEAYNETWFKKDIDPSDVDRFCEKFKEQGVEQIYQHLKWMGEQQAKGARRAGEADGTDVHRVYAELLGAEILDAQKRFTTCVRTSNAKAVFTNIKNEVLKLTTDKSLDADYIFDNYVMSFVEAAKANKLTEQEYVKRCVCVYGIEYLDDVRREAVARLTNVGEIGQIFKDNMSVPEAYQSLGDADCCLCANSSIVAKLKTEQGRPHDWDSYIWYFGDERHLAIFEWAQKSFTEKVAVGSARWYTYVRFLALYYVHDRVYAYKQMGSPFQHTRCQMDTRDHVGMDLCNPSTALYVLKSGSCTSGLESWFLSVNDAKTPGELPGIDQCLGAKGVALFNELALFASAGSHDDTNQAILRRVADRIKCEVAKARDEEDMQKLCILIFAVRSLVVHMKKTMKIDFDKEWVKMVQGVYTGLTPAIQFGSSASICGFLNYHHATVLSVMLKSPPKGPWMRAILDNRTLGMDQPIDAVVSARVPATLERAKGLFFKSTSDVLWTRFFVQCASPDCITIMLYLCQCATVGELMAKTSPPNEDDEFGVIQVLKFCAGRMTILSDRDCNLMQVDTLLTLLKAMVQLEGGVMANNCFAFRVVAVGMCGEPLLRSDNPRTWGAFKAFTNWINAYEELIVSINCDPAKKQASMAAAVAMMSGLTDRVTKASDAKRRA